MDHDMRLPPLKAPEDIADTRELKHKRLHPWWWRSDIYKTREAKVLRKSAASSKYFEIGYYRYELARRWLLSKKPEAKAPSALRMFKSENENKLSSICLRVTKEAQLTGAVYLPRKSKNFASFDQFKKITGLSGKWESINSCYWNLQASWEIVAGQLKKRFKQLQRAKRISSVDFKRKNQQPNWQLVEVWDCWEAGLDIPSKFSSANVHYSKVRNIKLKAKDFFDWLTSADNYFKQ